MQRPDNGNPTLPPGPKGRELRNLRALLFNFRGFMKELHDEYGDIVFYRIPGMARCAVFNADLIREFLTEPVASSFPHFLDPTSFGIMQNPGVFRVEGEEHRLLHDVILEAFEEHLPYHTEVMLEHVFATPERWHPGQVIDARDEMAHLVGGSILHSVCGRAVDPALAQDALWALKWDWGLSQLPVRTSWLRKMPIPPNWRARRAIEAFDEVIYDAIQRANDPHNEGRDSISVWVRAASRDDMKRLGLFDAPDKIRDEVYSLTLGNSDTPLNAVCHVIHYLGHNPTARERLEEEVDEVLGNRPITGADVDRLPYARAVFLETLRLAPAAYGNNGQVRATLDDCMLGDYLIPKGTLVQPCTGIPHRKPEYWERPEAFLPERWLGNGDSTPSGCPVHAYTPYGIGPRRCPWRGYSDILGVLAMAAFAQRFRLDPVSKEPPKAEVLGVGVKGPYPVTVTERRPEGR